MRRISGYIDEDTYRKLKVLAAARLTSISTIIRELVEKWVAEEQKKRPPE